MMLGAILATAGLSLLAVLNIVATVYVFRSDFTSRVQKAAQLILTWLIPFVGPILVIAMLSNSRPARDPAYDPAGDNQYLILQNTLPADTFDHHADAPGHGDS
jgi:tellurite resistance protein TehA-like permease